MTKVIRDGFALPTVMVASVVMLILLLSGLTATSSVNSAIRGQYNDKLAKDAADSGVRMATACIRNRTVHTSGLLKPNSTSCTNTTVTGTKPTYVLDTPTAKTYFEVSPPTQETYSDARYYNVDVTGYLLLYRPGSSTVWRTVTEKVDFKIQYQSQFATISQSGSLYVCGIINNKTNCWGRNVEGQLGNGSFDPSTQDYEQDADGNPIITTVVRNVPGTAYYDSRSDLTSTYAKDIELAAGSGSTCIITTSNSDTGVLTTYNSSRRVACWGDSEHGELGRGIVTLTKYAYPKWTYQTWASQSPAQYPRQIVSAGGFVCLIANRASGDTTGNTWCWGHNHRGQLGRGNTNDPYASPGRVRDVGNDTNGITLYAIATTPDAAHVCGRRSDYRVVCWGFNQWGQVGDGTDGTDGSNDSSSTTQRHKTYPVQTVTQADDEPMRTETAFGSIAVGGSSANDQAHSCAIGHADSGSPGILQGRIYCWGTNGYGQLGRGGANSSIYRKAWLMTAGFGGTNYSASKIAASNLATCAIVKVPATATQSSVYCWGSNEQGEIGVGTTTSPYPSATRVTFFDGKEVTDINGGAFRFCAVSDFSNYCWGRDQVGQVGDGQVTNCCEKSPSLSKFLEPDYLGLSY